MTPRAAVEQAVRAWWSALQEGDLRRLAELLDTRYAVTGGPEGRAIGRAKVLDQSAAFVDAGVIEHWSISEVHVVEVDQVAICTYRWEERGAHGGTPFELSGWATDVLSRSGSRWTHIARHVSMAP